MSGTGIVHKVGWDEWEGRKAFLAVVEFVDGPPDKADLPMMAVWQQWPVRIVALPPPPQNTER